MRLQRLWRAALVLAAMVVPAVAEVATVPETAAAATQQAPVGAKNALAARAKIEFTEETLDNGLRVIYAPLRQAPVVHVRVIYHVGSRDERPDRQGFAHMFEHMMFRGSAHVKPEEHMKLIGIVGGYCNAFTSFDATQYINTIPANQVDLALYLEADRMASFSVCDDIFKTERKVVAEEWRIKENQPYGRVYEDFLKLAFSKHPYRWSPIGDMDQLAAAEPRELQEFFNKYYVPNNAILLITGDIDVPAVRKMVRRYFGWIPSGADVVRNIPAEPKQTEPLRGEVSYAVPLPIVAVAYRTPGHGSDDEYVLAVLATIAGQGESSRLYRALVGGDRPLCVGVQASHLALEDHGGVIVGGAVLAGKSADDVEKTVLAIMADIAEKGVTPEELDKAKTLHRVSLVRSRQKADDLASQLGEEAFLTGDPNRVNTALARLEAVTREDVQAAAKKYFRPNNSITMHVKPDRLAMLTKAFKNEAKIPEEISAPATSSRPVEARDVKFPEGYPTQPTIADAQTAAKFAKGVETKVHGVRVIVMEDHRLPLVNWNLTMRSGSHCDPAGKEGLGELTASLVQRGQADLTYEQLAKDLESRGINLNVSDGGDYTRLSGSCVSDQLEHAMMRTRQMLREPTLPETELNKLKAQTIDGLKVSQEQPDIVAGNDLAKALYGESALGRYATPESVARISLEDAKEHYRRAYRPNGAYLIISGDVTVEQGQKLARQLLEGWEPAKEMPNADYNLPKPAEKHRIILVDRPDGQQAAIHMGIRAYRNQSEERYAGSVATTILSRGIDSRLGKYVRAEKGLAYGVWGGFAPGRQAGKFEASTDTSLETTGEAVEAVFKVFDDMCREQVTAQELREAKTRVAGGMVMGIQTISQQAEYRGTGILNDYPIDYYDTYPARIAAVTAAQVQEVMNRYVRSDRFTLVVVAPAEKVKAQLEKLGEVEIAPMPARRAAAAETPVPAPATRPAGAQPAERLKEAA